MMRLTDARGMAVAGIMKSLTEICAPDEVKDIYRSDEEHCIQCPNTSSVCGYM